MQSNTRTFSARSHDAVIRVYDAAGNMFATHEQAGRFKSGESALGTAMTKLHYVFERRGVGLENLGVRSLLKTCCFYADLQTIPRRFVATSENPSQGDRRDTKLNCRCTRPYIA
jgi:hypothetical protein